MQTIQSSRNSIAEYMGLWWMRSAMTPPCPAPSYAIQVTLRAPTAAYTVCSQSHYITFNDYNIIRCS